MTAVEVLRKYQKQCDHEGIEVQVSRQALDEVLDEIERLEAVVDAVIAHENNENFLNIDTWQACVAAARRARGDK